MLHVGMVGVHKGRLYLKLYDFENENRPMLLSSHQITCVCILIILRPKLTENSAAQARFRSIDPTAIGITHAHTHS